MKNKKYFLIIPVLAAFFVFIGAGKEHLFPWNNSLILNDLNTVDYVRTDKGFVTIYDKKLFFMTPDGELIRVVDTEIDGVQSEPRVLNTDGEYVYAIVGEHMENYNYFLDEKVMKYSFDGRDLGELYRKTYDEDDYVNYNNLTDTQVRDGNIYITYTDDFDVKLIASSLDAEKTNDDRIILEFEAPDSIQWGKYDIDQNMMTLFNRFGEAYFYDIATKEITFHPEVTDNGMAEGIDDEVVTFSMRRKVMDILYYVGIAILIISLTIGIMKLYTSGALKGYGKPIIFLLFFMIAVLYYTNKTFDEFELENKERTTAATDSVVLGLRYIMDDLFEDIDTKVVENYKTENEKEKIGWLVRYLQEASASNGKEMGMYAQIYMFDENDKPFLLADSYDEYPVGTSYEELSPNEDKIYNSKEDYLNEYMISKEVSGTYCYINRPFFGRDNVCIGFLEMGCEYGKLRKDHIADVWEMAMELLGFVVFLYVLFDVVGKYGKELKDYTRLRKTNPEEARYCLSNTYDFLVSGLLYMDCMLLVKAVASICEGSGDGELAILFAIPLTAYKAGSWIGSAIASSLIGKFGERRMGVISAVVSTISCLGMALSIYQKNVYILAACKFAAGIFLESVLFELSEGVPYEIEDEKERDKKVIESQSATQGASIVFMMGAGMVSSVGGYAEMYLGSAIICALLIPISMMALTQGSDEENEIRTHKVWASFFKPKSLLYIFMVVIGISFLCGYEDYIFPLFSENSGLSAVVLSSMGAIVCAASYFGENILVMFEKYTPLRAMAVAFSICGISMLLFILNQSVIFAVVVLLVNSVMLRVIESHKIIQLIELNENDELDAKDIQENYYTLEDGFKVLEGPVLGPLSAISNAAAIGFLGAVCLIFPRLYCFIAERRENKKA